MNKTALEHLIENELVEYLPLVQPLQQFIARNPLWDKTNVSLLKLTQDLHRKIGLQATLSLEAYHTFYAQGLIDNLSLKHAIQTIRIMICPPTHLSPSLFRPLERHLFNFMTSQSTQNKLNAHEKTFAFSEPEDKPLLLCYQLRSYFFEDPLNFVKAECLRWIAAFFDQGQASWPMPCEHNELFKDWRECLSYKNKKWQRFLSALPDDIQAFITALINELTIPPKILSNYLFQIVWQLKGWAGYIKWLNQNLDNPWENKTASIKSLIAMWLAYEAFFMRQHRYRIQHFKPFKNQDLTAKESRHHVHTLWEDYLTQQKDRESNQKYSDELDGLLHHSTSLSIDRFLLRWVWQTAWERKEHHDLLHSLKQPTHSTPSKRPQDLPPQAQWIFCIDTRSENIRRHIEKILHHDTLGFAGFFGFPFQLNNQNTGKVSWQCPALFKPQHILVLQKQSQTLIKTQLQRFQQGIKYTKQHMLAPFVLFEIVGLWFAIKLLGRTFFSQTFVKMARRLKKVAYSKQLNPIEPFKTDKQLQGFELKDATNCAENILKSIGLVDHFSEFVIVCGHKSASENNPYQAALDCGACGGNAGRINAIVACRVLNHPDIRQQLANRGIVIPDTTHFIAACHNTTTDTIIWFISTESSLSESQKKQLKQLKQSVKTACRQARQERLNNLPGDKNVFTRSSHWAELIPEWGLANNHAMIIGPRHLTQNCHLKQRVFLHSYEPELDPQGHYLEGILTGPVLVAHWINMQYYFSTTDPNIYGSGNKAIQNVTCQLGILQGNQGDIEIGLPSQSVIYQDTLIHKPIRLLVIIYGSKTVVDRLIEKHKKLKSLLEGHWLFLQVVEVGGGVIK